MTPDGRITVLHLCEHFGGREATLHGVARAFQWWLPHFNAQRFRVLLCSRKGWDKAADQMKAAGCEPMTLGYGKTDPRNLFKLIGLLRRERVDIIHAHGYGACTWGRIAGLLLGLPVIVHERCNYHTVPLSQRPVEWLLAKGTRHAFAVSESTRQFCIRKRYLRPEVVKTLYNGILLDDIPPAPPEWKAALRREQGAGPETRVLGVVGRIESHKGHQDALRALKTLRQTHPDVQLWIVGDGEYEPEVRRFAREQGLEEAVRFLGFRRDVKQVIQCFDLQIFPSHQEGTPNTLYEAMLAGNAPVASTADGQGEILEDGRTALMFQPGDHALLAAHLARLLDDPALAGEIRRNAKARIRDFDGRACIRAMEETYERIMKAQSRGS
jgi:glycosyltransferase involved in cell wall biosynthesis